MGKWDKYWREYSLKPGRSKKRMIKIMTPFLNHFSKNARILDAGCGTGYFSAFFASGGFEVYSIDTSKKALSITKKRLSSLNLNAKVKKMDVRKLKYPKNYFDVVFTDGLLEHFEKPENILIEFKRVLKPKGIVFTFVPNKYSYWFFLKPFLMKDIKENPFVLKRLLRLHKSLGFYIMKNDGLNVLPFKISPEFLGRIFGRILYVVAKK